MAAYIFHLPDIGEGIAEAEIVAWHVRLGDRLDEHQALVDVMTDKATVEMTSPVAGFVTAIHGEAGQLLAVGAPLVELEVDNAIPEGKIFLPERPAAPVMAVTPQASVSRPLASPATRRRAHELGINLQFVPGTGPGGRITAEDLDRFGAHNAATQGDGVTDIKIIGLRRKIAEKMQDTVRIPHFSYIEAFDLTELEALRKKLNAERAALQPKLTLLPFLMRGIVQLAPEFPQINARYDDKAGVLHTYAAVHIGIATQTPGGLVVAVVRHAEKLDLWGCARELARATSAARDGKAAREELAGSTLTLTSLGAMGGIASTPVLNAPEVAIIGLNKLIEQPVVKNGQIVIRNMMNVSSSFDHRIIDGYDAARFIQGLKQIIEQPTLLFQDQAKNECHPI
jgi:2-oxoisovalerate dehydrogenase E2 component (dihydrolipoyl transacylase)